MMSFRLKQIGLSLCLMASLLIGSASACMCSHHEDKAKSTEISCHGLSHEPAEKVETPVTGNAFDVDCICFVNQPAPFIVSKSENKKFKGDKRASNSDQSVPDIEFAAATAGSLPSPEFYFDLSYSNVLESLLPSRAPPRL